MIIAAVVVCYRTPPSLLERCLKSLAASGVSQTVVVDNSPSPAVRRRAEQYQARYLASANEGFAAGANRGAAAPAVSGADLILFLNPDAALLPGALRQAVQYIAAHPRCGVAGLLLVSPEGQPEPASFGPAVTPVSLFTRKLMPSRLPETPAAVGYVSGGALLIRRSLLQQLGGFDQRFFLYWEDVDLCRRARQAGWQVVLLPRARVQHLRGASLRDLRRKTSLADTSADRYFAKYYPASICLALRLLRSLYRLLSPQVW